MRWIPAQLLLQERALRGRDCFLLLQKGAGDRMKRPTMLRRTSATLGLIPFLAPLDFRLTG
jgi:hypothetical protein